MRWLFVTTEFPWPIVHGRWLRVYHLARMLVARGDEVSVLSFGDDDAGRAAYGEVGVTVVAGPEGRHVGRGPARCLMGPYAFDTKMARAVGEHAGDFDVVALSGSRMLQYSPEASAAGMVLAEFVDDPVLEYRRRQSWTLNPVQLARRLKDRIGRRRYEAEFLAPVAVSTFVSEADCESFSQRHPTRTVGFVPNGVDTEYFAPPEEPRDVGPEPTVVFTGHMSNPNNQRAATYIVREVAPKIWERVPDAKIQIVGAHPSQAVLDLAGPDVEVTGRVDDMRPYLWSAGVVLLAMRSGTGIKNKLLEAWAARAPVVATPLACQGVPAEDGVNLLLGQTEDELAQRVADVLADDALRDRLAEAGRQTVRAELTWSTVAEQLRDAVLSAAGPIEQISGKVEQCH